METVKAAAEPVLDVKNLRVTYHGDSRDVQAVRDVSFRIGAGEVFGLAGESGCGKSTVANAVMRLLKPPTEIQAEALRFQGRDLLALNGRELREFRWREIAMVFQSAMNSLNPVMTIGDQIVDIFTTHERMKKRAALERAAELLSLVSLPADRLKAYPHQLSGGMRQRVVIAMAVALRPGLLIMDEPTTALDVVVQQEIMAQIKDLQREFGFSVLFITHDMSLMVELSDRIGVMYAGRLVEVANAKELFAGPLHPYSEALMNAFPPLSGPRTELTALDDEARAVWAADIPDLREAAPGRWVAATEGASR
ncbi:ABC transporter ATP-binding protein [Streptomyces sp.]|uniref:ABC transporter ATP-binding protein n=1 Tax=Streptomyces sp. TaxID=1931 RepID=UPI002F3E3708